MKIYQDQSYSFEERAADLVVQMTLEEKILEMSNYGAAIPRLDLPFYNYWGEASHGCSGPFKYRQMDYTSFPVCLAMSQSWDTDKIKAVTDAISDETRAYANVDGDELHFWCPTINMARDPRNGRSDENFGEDPFLAGKLAASYIQGLQGDDEKYRKAIATPKHYMMNSSENNRHTGSSNADEATIREYYGRVFEYAIREGKAESIMTSYNRVNGVPAAANDFTLNTLLREEWGFDGFVVSDCGGVAEVYRNKLMAPSSGLAHFYAQTDEEASAMTITAGNDMSCGTEHRHHLLKAVQQGLISEDTMDKSLIRIFTSRFRLGLFDDPKTVPYTSITKDIVCDQEKQDLAVDIANDSIVLLKNEKGILPLKTDVIKNILVVGPNAKFRQLGGYSAGAFGGLDTVVNIMTLDGVISAVAGSNIDVNYEKGWCSQQEFKVGGAIDAALPGMNIEDIMKEFLPENMTPENIMAMFTAEKRYPRIDPDNQADKAILLARALEAAKKADLVIVVAGTDEVTASEEHDRETLELPNNQNEKIKNLLAVNANTVVVLTTLGTITGDFIDEAHTLVNAHFAGQEQGTAIANVLFGKVNPSGKLTATWYKNLSDLPHVNDYGLKKQDTYDKKGRTYMYFDGEVRYPFGYGLSYTTFEYSNLKINSVSLDANDTLIASVDVKNTGSLEGKEIVQLYIRKITPQGQMSNKPARQLKGFAKVSLKPGETTTVTIEVPLKEVTFFSNFYKKMMVEEGDYVVELGGNSINLPCSADFKVSGKWDAVLATVYVTSDKYIYTIGQEGYLKVSATTEDATHLCKEQYSSVIESTDSEVAIVDANGTIKAVGTGVALIKATVTYQGKTLQRAIPVAVKE